MVSVNVRSLHKGKMSTQECEAKTVKMPDNVDMKTMHIILCNVYTVFTRVFSIGIVYF